eukprot:scaffold25597_cov206-Cylindrotheca_fusiformis.AAC.3
MGLEVVWYWAKEVPELPDWLRPALSSALFTTKSNLLGTVDIILCDSKPPMWLRSWQLAPIVVSLRSVRFSASSLVQRSHVHSDLGGLTEQRVTVYGAASYGKANPGLVPPWEEPSPPVFLGMPVRSIASDTVVGRRKARHPDVRSFPPPLRVRPIGNNLYHSGGLYPTFDRTCPPRFRPKFLLPSVVLGWVHRRLTPSEEWMVFDVPYDITVLVNTLPSDVQQALWQRLLPGRCLQQALGEVLDGFGVRDGGGICLLGRCVTDFGEKLDESTRPSKECRRGGFDSEFKTEVTSNISETEGIVGGGQCRFSIQTAQGEKGPERWTSSFSNHF